MIEDFEGIKFLDKKINLKHSVFEQLMYWTISDYDLKTMSNNFYNFLSINGRNNYPAVHRTGEHSHVSF